MDHRPLLIVDDYPGARYLRSRILNDAGYEVIEASTGEEALRLARERLPALVLLDVNLPDISGTHLHTSTADRERRSNHASARSRSDSPKPIHAP